MSDTTIDDTTPIKDIDTQIDEISIEKATQAISQLITDARIDEINRTPRNNYGIDFTIHLNAYLDNRIKELNNKENK